MEKLTDYKSMAKRFRNVGVEQNVYKESYILFSNFLLQIKKTDIDMSYIPPAYSQDVQKCYNEIKKVATNYATTLGYNLEQCPTQMLDGLDGVVKLLSPAIDAAERLSKGESTNKFKDMMAVKDLLDTAAHFANRYSEQCEEIIDDINKFIDNGMLILQKDMNGLVSDFEKTSKTYEKSKKALKDQIEKLQAAAKSDTNAAFGLGVGTAVFLSLGLVVLGMTIATGGGTAPALVALVGMGAPCFVAGIFTVELFSEAHSVQAQINSITEQMSSYDKAIAQVDLYADGYNNLISQLEEVKKALETIKEEWQVLANEFTELSSKVNEGNDTLKDEEWRVLQNILNDIQQELDILETEIQKVDISGTTVTLADLNAEMSEEEMKVACEKAEQMPLLKYLRTAS